VLKKNTKCTVKGYQLSSTGYPRLRVSSGFISANRRYVKLPAVDAPDAKAAIAIDAASGRVLYSKNANAARSIASVSKLMVIYLTRQKVASDKYSMNSKVRITNKQLVRMSRSAEFGETPLGYHKQYKVRDLYELALTESNNAAAIQLGMWVSGSNTKFIKKMNSTAKKLGMGRSKFISASGLDSDDLQGFGLRYPGASMSSTNKVSAKGVAVLARQLIKKYPSVLDVTELHTVTIGGHKVHSTNQLLKGGVNYNATAKWLRVDGLKTGTTHSAGACFAGTAQPKGRARVITVVLAAKGNRFVQTRNLMASLYDHFVLKAS
jgi:D-alanyl-D-alanine carboxypeptidase (penicillin-binding protein 5/6)